VRRAVFLDRDGVINRIVYHKEAGIVDSPFTVSQFELLPRAGASVRRINSLGLKAIVVSNQPGVAKRHFGMSSLKAMDKEMLSRMSHENAQLDGIYYCLHHPQARDRRYKKRCGCRKPKPGLLIRAARDFDLSLEQSYMVGDNITDIQAGQAVGCTTFLIGNHKCDLCRFLSERKIKPDYIVPNLYQATRIIKQLEGG
jgi:D-glycero-D-manno-heptose 1,7-bisphosphate phosphatase